MSETVEVKAAAVALDTESATVGQVITEKQITDLPLNGRNFIPLLFLGAGAVEVDGEQGAMRQGVGNAISIMGARPTSNNFMIDGTSNIDTALGTPAAILSVDAIEEFKEQTKTYSAEYGFSANQINLVSKSGTNAVPRHLLRLHAGTSARRQELLRPAERGEARSWTRSSSAASISGADHQEQDLLPLQLRRHAHRRAASARSSSCRPRSSWPAASRRTIIDPAHRPAFPEQHHPAVALLAPRAGGAARTAGTRLRTAARRRATTQLVRTLPQTQNQFTVRIDQDLGQLRPGLRPLHEDDLRQPRPRGSCSDIGDQRLRAEHQELAGLPHLAHPEQPREPVPRRPRRRRGPTRSGIACPQADIDFLRSDGRLHRTSPTPSGTARASASRDIAGTGGAGQRLLGEQPAHVGHQQHHHLDHGQPHLQLRRELPPLVAAAGPRHGLPGQLRNFNAGFHRETRSRTSCSATTRAPPPSSPRRSASRAGRATRVSSTSRTSPPTSRTTGR